MVLAVPTGHPLTKQKTVRLRDLRSSPFVWFHRWVNPVFHDRMIRACARGGLTAPRIVQEATDRDTNLGLVLCRIGLSWQPETVRWHCPRGVALVTVVDMNVRLPFHLIWKKDNSSPLLRRFVAQVEAQTLGQRN
jgi:DNA-binding transcriptional LysR family regulator